MKVNQSQEHNYRWVSSQSIPELEAKGKGDDEHVWNRMVGRMRGAVGSMLMSSLIKHEVGWAEWTLSKRAGSS
jgi:hypothetical protein